tara:strand:- start:47898 stop:48242 length:345 start_codon:yes stop_codon:yes gene_type:complete
MKNKYYLLAFFLISVFPFSVNGQNRTDSVHELTSKKREYNQKAKNGFCIQLYNGNEETAIEKINQFRALFPEVKVKRIYKVPEWKIQTLTFKTRIEADRVLNKINQEYPGARVL